MTVPPGNTLPEPLPPAAQQRVVDVLTRHFANDLLTEAELEARLQRVYSARTLGELEGILRDLPALQPARAAPVPAGQAAGSEIRALFSGQESKLSGVVPRELKLRAQFGYVELDLTRATFAPGLTIIDVRALMGYVQIRFPRGVRVESQGRAVFGFFSLKGGGVGGEGGAGSPPSVVRVTGRAVFGFAECFAPPERGLPAGRTGGRLPEGRD